MTNRCMHLSPHDYTFTRCTADAKWAQHLSPTETRDLCEEHMVQAQAKALETGMPCEFDPIAEKTAPDAIDNVLDVLEDIGLPGVRTDGLPRMRRAQVG